MNRRKNRTGLLLASFLLFIPMLCQTVHSDAEEEKKITVYRTNTQQTFLEAVNYVPEGETVREVLFELVQFYNQKDTSSDAVPVLPDEVQIIAYNIKEDGVLELHFSGDYRDIPVTREVLCRAGAVKTFLQLDGVNAVHFLVGEEEFLDQKGEPVGNMNGDSFVEIFSSDRESYRYDTFTLYFTDKNGRKLLPETRRVYYRSSIPKARVALEQLAKGPIEKGHYPTLPDSTELRTVVLSDKACYADFDRTFVEQALELDPEIPLYSVVNTLIANIDAEKVEISIAGNPEAVLGEDTELYRYYRWNSELVPEEESS